MNFLDCFSDEAEIKHYLVTLIKGIGGKTADLLLEHFGKETLKVLETEPGRLLEVPTIKQYRYKQIITAWTATVNSPERDALAFMLKNNLTLNLALKVYEFYGNRVIKVLQTNPYQLCNDINGIGFITADKIALDVGIAVDSPFRYKAGITYAFKQATLEGHCFLPKLELLNKSAALLNADIEKLYPILGEMLNSQELVEGNLSESIYLPIFYRTEIKLAQFLRWMAANKPDDCKDEVEQWIDDVIYQEQLTTEQANAIINLERESISILTGGPGTGKTYTMKMVLKWLRLQNRSVALAAPTGKAAKRLSTSSKEDAQTIHRLLEYSLQDQNFRRNANNPLEEDVVIVDEVSMGDIFLMNSLLKAIKSDARLLLIGDVHQLPSVGPGTVLRDAIASETIAVTRLTKLQRHTVNSPIAIAAKEINEGKMPELTQLNSYNAWVSSDASSECYWYDVTTPAEAVAAIQGIIASSSLTKIPKTEIKVLGFQKKGEVGVNNLNKLLQEQLNPADFEKSEIKIGEEVCFRLGDTVMQTVNNYQLGVMNGEEGQIIEINNDKKYLMVKLPDNTLVRYDNKTWSELTLSYSITTHKSQGSEYQVVIIPVMLSNYMMLSRQIIYTAITRASQIVFLVGQKSAFWTAIRTNRPAQRYTQLTQHLLAEELTAKNVTIKPKEQLISVQQRVKQLNIEIEIGKIVKIGSLALQMYEAKYQSRPPKVWENVGERSFKTYHYPQTAVNLIDLAIKAIVEDLFTSK